MIIRLWLLDADGVEARLVGGVDVAASRQIGLHRLIQLFEYHRLVGHVVRLEVVGEIEFGGGSRLHADGGAIELLGRFYPNRLFHHEALAIVIVDAPENETQRAVTRDGPGRVADQHVDLAPLQGGDALLGGGGYVFDLARIAKYRGRDGFAVVDV